MSEQALRGALKGLQKKFGWMDSMDYDHELGDAPSNEIHATEEGCRKAHKCIQMSEANPQDSYNCAPKRVVVIDADELEAAIAAHTGSVAPVTSSPPSESADEKKSFGPIPR